MKLPATPRAAVLASISLQLIQASWLLLILYFSYLVLKATPQDVGWVDLSMPSNWDEYMVASSFFLVSLFLQGGQLSMKLGLNSFLWLYSSTCVLIFVSVFNNALCLPFIERHLTGISSFELRTLDFLLTNFLGVVYITTAAGTFAYLLQVAEQRSAQVRS